jgi:hypothetical protein
MIQAASTLSDPLKLCALHAANGDPYTVGELCSERCTLLLFVRHFGCIGCSENIGLLAPRFQELSDLGVRVVIIGVGAPNFIEGFQERHNLLFGPAEIFVDESLATHQAAELTYGRWAGLGPRAWVEMGRAFVSGHVSGAVQGDIQQHAGALLVDAQGVVQLYHRNRSIGDHVSGSQLVEVALAMWLRANPDLV